MTSSRKRILSSVIAIFLCLAMISGATFALFTDEAKVNIAVTSGKVDVTAEIVDGSLKLYSAKAQDGGDLVDENGKTYVHEEVAKFTNGGEATFDANELTLDRVSPGDKVTFDIQVANNSNIAVQYRVKINCTYGADLFYGLEMSVAGKDFTKAIAYTSEWASLMPKEQFTDDTALKAIVPVSLELPIDATNRYQDKTTKITYTVEAVQGNASTDNNGAGTEYLPTTWSELAATTAVPAAVNGVITITNAHELAALANSVNAGNNYEGITVVLGDNIDLAGAYWTPIGAYGNTVLSADFSNDDLGRFSGTFDGQEYTVSGLTVAPAGSTMALRAAAPVATASGLFGVIDGTVKNLTVKNATVKGAINVGVIAGAIYPLGLIENVTVEKATVSGEGRVGGVVGYAYGNVNNASVANVTLTAVPTQEGSKFDNGDKVGGVIGYFCEDQGNKVTNCSAENVIITAYRDAGGIAGAANAGAAFTGNQAKNVDITIDQSNGFYAVKEPNAGGVIGRVLTGALDPSNLSDNFTWELIESWMAKADEEGLEDNTTTDDKGKINAVEIYTAEQLAALALEINTKNEKGYTASGVVVTLMADIDLAGTAWSPISDGWDNIFRGTFDGNGHKISNITVNKTYSGYGGALFQIFYGTAKNLTVENANISDTSGSWDTGVIAGYSYGNIIDCTVKNSTVTGTGFVGGLVGYQGEGAQKITGNTIENVTITSGMASYGEKMLGALAGYLQYGNVVENNTITNVTLNIVLDSASDMTLFASTVNEKLHTYKGINVLLGADIDMDGIDWEPIGQTGTGNGSFQGVFDGQGYTLSNLTIDSDDETGAHYSSGIFGWIEDHSNTAEIKNVNVDGATVKGHHNVAVIVGWTNRPVTNCHVTNAVIECTNANDEANGDKAGVIVGYVNPADKVFVWNCSATDSSVSAGRDAGQIVGATWAQCVAGCKATNVTVTANGTGTGANINERIIGRISNEASIEKVEDFADLKDAVANGGYISLEGDMPGTASAGGYSKAGISQLNGGTIDGNGNKIDVSGSDGTWDCGIYTKGGTIKNATVSGSFRGIFLAHLTQNLYLENVTFNKTTYTISIDYSGPILPYTVNASNCNFYGWTSYSNICEGFYFTDCTFGEGNGYAFMQPYCNTVMTNCNFEDGYELNMANGTLTLINCTYNGVLITAENVCDLLWNDAQATDGTVTVINY